MLIGRRPQLALGDPAAAPTDISVTNAQQTMLAAIEAREGRQTNTLFWTAGAMAVAAGLAWQLSDDYKKTPAWAVGGLGVIAIVMAALVGAHYDKKMLNALRAQFVAQGVPESALPG